MTINFTDLFTRLGKLFKAQEVTNTARGSTVPPTVKAYTDELASTDLLLQQAVAPAEVASRQFQQSATALVDGLKRSAELLLTGTVRLDATLPNYSTAACLAELARQMIAEGETVDASTAAVSASAITGNGDAVLVASAKLPDGRNAELALAEVIKLECTNATTPRNALFTARGAVSQSRPLSHDWPLGSGVATTVLAISANDADNLISNGALDSSDDQANVPDDWFLAVGTAGTDIKMTNYEVQQIAVTGTPTAGTYIIRWTAPSGKAYATSPLAYNASGTAVQAALRTIPGLGSVTVATSGTSPDYTHVITFTDQPGNLNAVTVTNNTTGGTFTISTTTQGSANAFIGRSVELDSDGSTLTTLYQTVSLEPLTQYAVNLWAMADVVPAAGGITVDLVDGIGGSVIADAQSTNNSFTISCPGLSTSFAARNGIFRTPRVLPAAAMLRIRITTAISAGTSVFVDHIAMRPMQQIYAGGPSLAIFSGKTDIAAGAVGVSGDTFTLTVTNDRAGKFQEWFDRNFDLRTKGILLPSDSSGSETINDSLIS